MAGTREATAVHEAAHAVIGRVLGMTCGHATVLQDEDSAGHAVTADPWVICGHWEERGKYRDPSSVFRGRIMTFMAGVEAEREFYGSDSGGDGDDRFQIAMMAEHANVPRVSNDWDSDVDRYLDRLRSRTRGLVRRHRRLILKVSAELLTRGTLIPEEIEALMK